MKQHSFPKDHIAYLGIPGSFSHQAAHQYFASDELLTQTTSVREVFTLVKEEKVIAGVVPLENSINGNVVESFDLLGEHNLFIVGEIYLKICHCLLGKKEIIKSNDYRSATRCFSHWQAISQCDPFFTAHPWITPTYVGDTASAAQQVAQNDSIGDLAIASRYAAELYGLPILETHLEKHRDNYTRFGVISKTANNQGEKISLSFSVKHVPGSLVLALTPYSQYGLNLMQIESRPKAGSPWEYTFFVDLEIGTKVKEWEMALNDMRQQTNELKILGRYPKGALYET